MFTINLGSLNFHQWILHIICLLLAKYCSFFFKATWTCEVYADVHVDNGKQTWTDSLQLHWNGSYVFCFKCLALEPFNPRYTTIVQLHAHLDGFSFEIQYPFALKRFIRILLRLCSHTTAMLLSLVLLWVLHSIGRVALNYKCQANAFRWNEFDWDY